MLTDMMTNMSKMIGDGSFMDLLNPKKPKSQAALKDFTDDLYKKILGTDNPGQLSELHEKMKGLEKNFMGDFQNGKNKAFDFQGIMDQMGMNTKPKNGEPDAYGRKPGHAHYGHNHGDLGPDGTTPPPN